MLAKINLRNESNVCGEKVCGSDWGFRAEPPAMEIQHSSGDSGRRKFLILAPMFVNGQECPKDVGWSISDLGSEG